MTRKTVTLDAEVINKIASEGKFGESMNDVLRRILKLPTATDKRADNGRKKVASK